jgi:hypothetical protein
LFQLSSVSEEQYADIEAPEALDEQLFLAISHEAQQGSTGRCTIQFLSSINNISITVLVDSGSLASFLATSVADQLPHLQRVPMQAAIKIVNGQILQCTTTILAC